MVSDVNSGRLSGTQEADLIAMARLLSVAQAEVDRLTGERDRLVADIVAAGVPVADIAEVLSTTETTIHGMIERGKQR